MTQDNKLGQDPKVLARKRENMKLFIASHHDHTVDGKVYQHLLQTQGRRIAQAAYLASEARLMRAALSARTDIYGNPLEDNIPLITGVALMIPGVEMLWLPAPYRHSHLVQSDHYRGLNQEEKGITIEGFIVDDDYFVNRTAGAAIAIAANQLNKRPMGRKLFSENVWAAWDDHDKEEVSDLIHYVNFT